MRACKNSYQILNTINLSLKFALKNCWSIKDLSQISANFALYLKFLSDKKDAKKLK